MKSDRQELTVSVSRAVQLGACCFLGCIIVIYAGLIGIGQWGGDEYGRFYEMRTVHLYLLGQMEWSPRPISELILYAYGRLLNHFHRPLTIPLLGMCWLGFLFAGVFTYWQKRRQLQDSQASVYLLLGLLLMALCLAGGKPAEVFYWPVGTAAYLLTLSATLLFFLQTLGGALSTPRGRMLASTCLVGAAWSSEAGAIFVVCYAVVQLALRGWACFRSPVEKPSSPPWWWAVPSLLALMVLLVVRIFRFNVQEFSVPANTPPTFASLIAGLKEIGAETLGSELAHQLRVTIALPGPRPLVGILLRSRLTMEILLAMGIALCCFRLGKISKDRATSILGVVVAFLLASVCTIAATLLHFGLICCDRHATLREGWTVMCVVGVVIASTAWAAEEKLHRGAKHFVAGLLLLCASVFSVLPIRPLFWLYRNYPAIWRANEQNFQSGFRTGETQMQFFAPPSISLLDSVEGVSPGVYTKEPGYQRAAGEDDYIESVLTFFDKTSIVVYPPLSYPAASEIPTEGCAVCSQRPPRAHIPRS